MTNPRVFCINLDRSPERWNFMVNQKNKLGQTKLERISGVDGYILDKDELMDIQIITSECYHLCSPGMIGCWLSHLKIWKKVVDEDIPYAVILEDDAIIPNNYSEKINRLINFVPENADIVLLGCLMGCRDDPNLNLMEKMITMFYKPRDYSVVNQEIIVPQMFTGTFAYLITNRGAKKCLKELGKVSYHIDNIMSKNKELNLYAVKKMEDWFETYAYSSNSTLNGNVSNKKKEEMLFFGHNFSINWALNTPLFQLPFGIIFNGWLIIKIIIIILVLLICQVLQNKRSSK